MQHIIMCTHSVIISAYVDRAVKLTC